MITFLIFRWISYKLFINYELLFLDSVTVMAGYSDVIVLRHSAPGAAAVSIEVINMKRLFI